MPDRIALLAMLVAVLSGYGVIRHGRQMLHEGVGIEDGGGWALLLTEFTVCFAAVGVALSF